MSEPDMIQPERSAICRGGRCLKLALVVVAVVGGLTVWRALIQDDVVVPAEMAEPTSSVLLPGSTKPPAMPVTGQPQAAPGLPGLDVMADRLATRLEKDPSDGEGWALLARTYLELGNLAKADQAYEHALKLRPGDATMKADYMAARKALAAAPH